SVGEPPVILEVEPKHVRAVSPGACAQTASHVRRKSKEEIRFSGPAATPCLGQRIRACAKFSREIHEPGSAVVAGVENVELVTPVLETGMHDMPALGPNDGILDQGPAYHAYRFRVL